MVQDHNPRLCPAYAIGAPSLPTSSLTLFLFDPLSLRVMSHSLPLLCLSVSLTRFLFLAFSHSHSSLKFNTSSSIFFLFFYFLKLSLTFCAVACVTTDVVFQISCQANTTYACGWAVAQALNVTIPNVSSTPSYI